MRGGGAARRIPGRRRGQRVRGEQRSRCCPGGAPGATREATPSSRGRCAGRRRAQRRDAPPSRALTRRPGAAARAAALPADRRERGRRRLEELEEHGRAVELREGIQPGRFQVARRVESEKEVRDGRRGTRERVEEDVEDQRASLRHLSLRLRRRRAAPRRARAARKRGEFQARRRAFDERSTRLRREQVHQSIDAVR